MISSNLVTLESSFKIFHIPWNFRRLHDDVVRWCLHRHNSAGLCCPCDLFNYFCLRLENIYFVREYYCTADLLLGMLKNRQTTASFSFIFSLFNQSLQFYNKSMWKMVWIQLLCFCLINSKFWIQLLCLC